MNLSPKLILFLILVGFMFLCSFVLQRLLSKQENPWIGLALPFICFFVSLIGGIGQLITHRHMGLDVVLKDFLLVSAFNVATVIHLIIYFVSRKTKPENENKPDDDNGNFPNEPPQ